MSKSSASGRSLPFGSWPSELSAERIAAGGLRLSEPRVDRGAVYWLEGRPSEAGRTALMRSARDGEIEECTPPAADARSCVHEYGGGAYCVRDGRIFYVDHAARRLRELGEAALGRSDARYADLELAPDGRWLVAVEERAPAAAVDRADAEPDNRIVALAVAARGGSSEESTVVFDEADFVSTPRFSADGSALAFTAWNHPNMPWDEAALYVVGWGESGASGTPRRVAGGPGESICQPRFGPDGRLYYVSDRSGWWNLTVLDGDQPRPLCAMASEFAGPQWVFGLSSYAFADAQTLLCTHGRGGEARLARLDVPSGELRPIALDLSVVGGVQMEGDLACFLGASPSESPGVFAYELEPRRLHRLRTSGTDVLTRESISVPEAIEFPSEGGRRAHGYYYAPCAAGLEGEPGERPPLLVKSHGGPTSATSPALDLRVQYWTSRGFAVVDVNYGGSTGYGRPYRELLRGAWGVVDVDDCTHAALYLASEGRVDRDRLLISGGSAGGYTTLCALTFRDVFRAGASHYGIGDLEALARDTHKFESRYTDGLVGPYPEAGALYRERAPIHHCEQLSCPVIFFQGLEDKVVPPNQAQAMVAALAARGIPHAYVPFEGEGHGFRRAENIRTALEGELYFYGQVFGFEVDVEPEGVQIVRSAGPA